ncbi:hypothetical protein ACFX2B_032652 [Malus domestica]
MSSWKFIEDVTLCECWVHTTHDPITVNEMDKQEMLSKIRKRFAMYMKKTPKVVKILQAQAFYNVKNHNKSFNKWECWQIIKDCPRYKIVSTGPEVVMHNMSLHSSPEPNTTEQEGDTFENKEVTPEEVPETQPTHQSLRPQGQGELNMAREANKDEEQDAAMVVIIEATETRDAAAKRQREIVNQEKEMIREALNRENEMFREERIAQADRDIMNKYLVGLSPNSKYFLTSKKKDVVRRRRERDVETIRGGYSYTNPSNEDPCTTYPSSRDFV